MSGAVLKAPFPAFGGKSAVADMVWSRFGEPKDAPRNYIEPMAGGLRAGVPGGVHEYIEPFCFSAAVLLRRPGGAGAIETINDANAFVANFWRAVRSDPDAVAEHCDWPVNETDLHTRHRWMVGTQGQEILARVREEPDFFDARIAGWWAWGACMWIGSGWCDETHRNSRSAMRPDLDTGQVVVSLQMPHVDNAEGGIGRGVLRSPSEKRAKLSGNGVGTGVHSRGDSDRWITRPVLSRADDKLHKPDDSHRPQLADQFSRGRGVHGSDDRLTCAERSEWIRGWIGRLADRLRPVRVCCGHWARVCDSPSTMTRLGVTAVFLDPPYRLTLADGTVNRTSHIYANDRAQDVNALCDEVQEWCLKWGNDPKVRIALCGLEGEYPKIDALVSPTGARGAWECWAWKGRGGYGNRTGAGKANAARERIWFSPHCVRPDDEAGLFAMVGEEQQT